MSTAQLCNRKHCKRTTSQSKSYRLCDIDVDNGCCAEGRRAPVPGLDHHRPLAVLLLGDVMHNLHRLNVGFQFDLASVCIDLKCIVGICGHDGVFNDIVWRLSVFIHGL